MKNQTSIQKSNHTIKMKSMISIQSNQSINQSVNQSNQSIHQSTQSFNQIKPINQIKSIQSINQSINQPINQSINQSTTQTNQSNQKKSKWKWRNPGGSQIENKNQGNQNQHHNEMFSANQKSKPESKIKN